MDFSRRSMTIGAATAALGLVTGLAPITDLGVRESAAKEMTCGSLALPCGITIRWESVEAREEVRMAIHHRDDPAIFSFVDPLR